MAEVKKDMKLLKEKAEERKHRHRFAPYLAPISKQDIEKFGATTHCQGCEFYITEGTKRRPHCLPCKMRFLHLFIENKYEKGLAKKEILIDFLQPTENTAETEAMDTEPAPLNEEPTT